jgi:hypothetical protein
MDDAGNFVVAWESYDENYGTGRNISARRFDAMGNALGGDLLQGYVGANVQANPAAAMDADGDFVVVWQSYGQDQAGNYPGIFGRRFGSDGSALGGEFLVNTFTAGAERDPKVAMSSDGDFVVVWQGVDERMYGTSVGVFGQRFASGGARLGGEFQVNVNTVSEQRAPVIARSTPTTPARNRSISPLPRTTTAISWWSGSGRKTNRAA